MDIFTHFLIGILTSIYSLKSMPFSVITYAAMMSIIADFDLFIEPLNKIKKSNFLLQKGLSHSYFTALVVSFFTAIIFASIANEHLINIWIIGLLFYILHISLDLITASKIPIFYPFSKKRYRFFIDKAINLFLALISGLIILFYSVIFFFLPQLFFSNLYHYVFGFYLIYFSYRFISKIWIQLKLPKNSLYIPSIIHFVYFIYKNELSGNTIIYQLTKKIQFSNKKAVILTSQLSKESNEMKLYEIAMEKAKDYTFFTKWIAVIPIIEKNDNLYTIFLILAESYFSGSAYTLKIVFNRSLNEIEMISDGFNLLKK